jgi:hypothetical protein
MELNHQPITRSVPPPIASSEALWCHYFYPKWVGQGALQGREVIRVKEMTKGEQIFFRLGTVSRWLGKDVIS